MPRPSDIALARRAYEESYKRLAALNRIGTSSGPLDPITSSLANWLAMRPPPLGGGSFRAYTGAAHALHPLKNPAIHVLHELDEPTQPGFVRLLRVSQRLRTRMRVAGADLVGALTPGVLLARLPEMGFIAGAVGGTVNARLDHLVWSLDALLSERLLDPDLQEQATALLAQAACLRLGI